MDRLLQGPPDAGLTSASDHLVGENLHIAYTYQGGQPILRTWLRRVGCAGGVPYATIKKVASPLYRHP